MLLMPVAFLLTGCNPQDATVEGDLLVLLSADSSENVKRVEGRETHPIDVIKNGGFSEWDCRDLRYLAEEVLDAAGEPMLDENGLPLMDYAAADEERLGKLVEADYLTMCCIQPAEGGDTLTFDNCEPKQPAWFSWTNQYAYWAKQVSLKTDGENEPWRTEAVLTTEGDLQLTVHVRQPPFEDFRFGWVIDPDFQPMECVDGAEGAELQQVDDASWLENWSAKEDGATLYYLNSGAYQIDPTDGADYWFFPNDWKAGHTFARYGDEEFYGHSTDYQDVAGSPLYFPYYADVGGIPTAQLYENWVAKVDEYFNGAEGIEPTVNDLADITASFEKATTFPVSYEIEDNTWRLPEGEADTSAIGLEEWLGINVSWVRVDNPQDIAAHNEKPVTGEYQIYLESAAAASKILVKGTFSIDNIREDTWGYESPDGYSTLEEDKRVENDTPACGE